ncbi:MAG TPA: hypothetical protein VM077_02855 [Candidatus Limnocylindrales bacterium]|nr:hypothetical protein [Candidatus Limnocylindrales bacterium]
MSKEELRTEVVLTGRGVKKLLERRGIRNVEKDKSGKYVVATFTGDESSAETGFGKLSIEYKLVNNTSPNGNRTIVIFGDLRQRGHRDVRKVTLNHETGEGYQEFGSGMYVGVRTNAGADIFVRGTEKRME